MRITHVVEHLPTGGLERVVVDLVGEQIRRGHECQVICLHDRGRLAQELLDQGVAVHACNKRMGIDLVALWRARSRLRAHRSDVLHTHNNTAHYIALSAAFGLGFKRVVNTRHGMGASSPDNRRERRYARTMRHTHAVVAVCETAGKAFMERALVPAGKLRVVPNGIHVEKFRPVSTASRLRVRKQLGLPATTRIIGSVGRLNRIKDQATLVDAVARLRAQGEDVALLLVGEGRKRHDLEMRIDALGLGGHVFLPGDRDDVADWMAGFDVFALSSVSEGYSIALLEACASALPIVATRVGGNPEIVRDGVNGLLVPPADPQALSSALAAVLADTARGTAFGSAGLAWVRAHGSVASMADGYEEVYAECR